MTHPLILITTPLLPILLQAIMAKDAALDAHLHTVTITIMILLLTIASEVLALQMEQEGKDTGLMPTLANMIVLNITCIQITYLTHATIIAQIICTG